MIDLQQNLKRHSLFHVGSTRFFYGKQNTVARLLIIADNLSLNRRAIQIFITDIFDNFEQKRHNHIDNNVITFVQTSKVTTYFNEDSNNEDSNN